MSTLRFLASVSLALLVGSGAALAQTARDNPTVPENGDHPSTSAPGDTVKAQTQDAEKTNPHSTLNKDRVVPADSDKAHDLDRAEKDNPHHIMNQDRDGMGGKVTASAVLERLAAADQGEVQMGKLAQSNGSSRAQEYGRMLEQDHAQGLQQVKDLGQKKGIAIAEMPRDGMAKHEMDEGKQMHDKLAKLQGAEFDKAFAGMMVEDHQKVIDHLKAWRGTVGDKDVAALIDQTLPVLQRHLSAAQRLRMPAAQGRTP